ncbi:MAG: lipoprotein B transmembrane [Betaproteobacteria bacterium]|nr:lipoprotein B transmembrane [Betaproteobacteria bacterium]
MLSACGFQLRGDTATGLKSLYLSTAASSQVAVEIRHQLSGGPTKLVTTPKDAEAHLRILSESTEKIIQTLTGAGRVFDYRLRLKVGYQVTDAAEKPLIEPTEIELWRIVTYSESAPLAKEAEEQFLYVDMRVEAASRILRRIAVARANAPPR